MPMLARPDSPGAVNSFRRAAAVILLTVVLAACGKTEPKYVDRPVDELYNGAMNAVAVSNWAAAAAGFDEVERQHPYSVWATRAEIMAAYAYYQQNKYTDAVSAAQRFLQLHPGNKDAPYAYYLIAICYYEQITDVRRDQKITEQALQALQEVVRRYPTSEYARDARLKIDLTNDHLAGKEMAIGRYYLRQGLYIGAINRFRTVIEKYQTTTQVPEALHRLTEAYLSLGVTKEAQDVAAVLGYNYPGSEWYADTYTLLTGQKVASSDEQKAKEGWFGRAWDSLF